MGASLSPLLSAWCPLADVAVVCAGHTSCGAVKAAIADSSDDVLTNMDETRIDVRPLSSPQSC